MQNYQNTFKGSIQNALKKSIPERNNLPLVKLKGCPKVILSTEVWSKFYQLHDLCGSTEWSGFLFYDFIGDKDKPDEIIINVKYFQLLDIGTPGFTKYTPDEKIMELYDKRPDLEVLQLGVAHTHHNMQVYFSVTDEDQLKDGAETFQMFLSVIVNTKGNKTSRVSFIGERKNTSSFMTFVNSLFKMESDVEKVVFYYECDTEIENEEDVLYDYNLHKKQVSKFNNDWSDRTSFLTSSLKSGKNHLPIDYIGGVDPYYDKSKTTSKPIGTFYNHDYDYYDNAYNKDQEDLAKTVIETDEDKGKYAEFNQHLVNSLIKRCITGADNTRTTIYVDLKSFDEDINEMHPNQVMNEIESVAFDIVSEVESEFEEHLFNKVIEVVIKRLKTFNEFKSLSILIKEIDKLTKE